MLFSYLPLRNGRRRSNTSLSTTSSSSTTHSKRLVSCEGCRTRKLRCSRTANCANCVKRGIECEWIGSSPRTSEQVTVAEQEREIQRLNRLVARLGRRIVDLGGEMEDDGDDGEEGDSLPFSAFSSGSEADQSVSSLDLDDNESIPPSPSSFRPFPRFLPTLATLPPLPSTSLAPSPFLPPTAIDPSLLVLRREVKEESPLPPRLPAALPYSSMAKPLIFPTATNTFLEEYCRPRRPSPTATPPFPSQTTHSTSFSFSHFHPPSPPLTALCSSSL